MNILNRQINTGFNKQADQRVALELLKDIQQKKKGEVIYVSKSEAKRLLSVAKSFYRIKLD